MHSWGRMHPSAIQMGAKDNLVLNEALGS